MSIVPKDSYYLGEIQASQYYVHNYYVNTYYYVYKFLEDWISSNIFRNDKTRVFMASDDYCFRRRFELTDTSKDFSTLDFSSLRFPFANYWPQNSAWIVDPRIAAKSASLTYLGIYEGNTKLRAAQSLFTIPVTLWFNREDDARFAYDILYFNSYNEHYYSVNVPYGRDTTIKGDKSSIIGSTLSLPMNLEISEINFNPEFKETDWLKKQRVFPIKVDFRVRSYAILPPKQPDYNVTLNVNGTLSDGSSYISGFNFYYIVDDVILNFNERENKVQTYDAGYIYNDEQQENTYLGSTPFPTVGETGVVYVDSYISSKNKSEDTNLPTNLYIWDEINQKYVKPEYDDLDVKSIRAYEKYEISNLNITKVDCLTKIKANSNVINWEYFIKKIDLNKESDLPSEGNENNFYFIKETQKGYRWVKEDNKYNESTLSDMVGVSDIEIHLVNRDIIKVDKESLSYKVSGLTSNTQYYGYIIFYSSEGSSKRFVINFTTPMTKDDEINNKGVLNSLVGIKL